MEQAYTTNMGWQNVHSFRALLAPNADVWALVLAAGGLIVALIRRRRPPVLLALLGGAAAVATVIDPQGKLYNTRFAPLWWLCVYLVAGYGFAELGVGLARNGRLLWTRWSSYLETLGPLPGSLGSVGQAGSLTVTGMRSTPAPDVSSVHPVRLRKARWAPWAPGAVVVPLVGLAAACMVVMPPLLVSPTSTLALPSADFSVHIGPLHLGPVHVRHSSVPDWVTWNYSGYQRKPGWTEYQAVVSMTDRAAQRYGCGRALWEYSSDLDRFGTPMSLMLLPYWTGGCVDTQEGLLFESSTTTPYHFIDQSELSAAPSDAMVGLPYTGLNVPLGIAHLQLLGVRYFLASSPSVQAQANADPEVTEIGSSGPWHTPYQGQVIVTTWKLYLVHNASTVAPLREQPQVLVGVGAGQTSWLPVAEQWYDDPSRWATELVDGGPPGWMRVTALGASGSPVAPVPLPAVRVSGIRDTGGEISFHVDRTGVPVLVRTSYFPAWHATGALGPWRAEPNLMVVVPTTHDVTMHYGSTGPGRLGLVLTLIGLVALAMLVARRAFDVP
jgi:hypothetical protein